MTFEVWQIPKIASFWLQVELVYAHQVNPLHRRQTNGTTQAQITKVRYHAYYCTLYAFIQLSHVFGASANAPVVKH